MATQLKKTVKPSGGDYTSLEACMNANEQNLVTADKYFDVEIDGSWSIADTTNVTVHNYTTDATRYINIYATGTARHDGRVAAVSGRSNYIADLYIDNHGISNVTYDGLEINHAGATFQNYFSDNLLFKNCIFRVASSEQGSHGINIRLGSPSTMTIRNCIFYGNTANWTIAIYHGEGTATIYCYNVTVYGWQCAFSDTAGTMVMKNCVGSARVSGSWNVHYYNGGTNFSSDSTNNMSGDASTPEYNTYYDSTTPTYVNTGAGTEDFHLASNDTVAIAHGADLSATFTDDIDGVTRSGTWDIGADEYVNPVTNLSVSVQDRAVDKEVYV